LLLFIYIITIILIAFYLFHSIEKKDILIAYIK
jgi:hypothetical protein